MAPHVRALFALGLCAVGAAACGSRKAVSASPMPPPRAPHAAPVVHSDGALETRNGRVFYDDRSQGLSIELPAGWAGATSFPMDDSGPPAGGTPRLRARLGPAPFCVIDVSVEPVPASGEALRGLIPRGRDLFYFAQIDVPSPATMPVLSIWTSTAFPSTAGATDVGYWILTADRVVRLEGRFPSNRMPDCKAALDAMVVTVAPWAEAAPSDRRAARSSP